MITKKESLPKKSKNFRIAEDIFYVQFNDVSFFIEDEEQENFFFCILRKLFPDMKLKKIFPLGGKDVVIEQSKKYENDSNKIYIVDKDFDDILNQKENYSNLFYLRRYSIENHLIEEESLIKYVISEKPRIDRDNIEEKIDLDKLIRHIGNIINDIVYFHIIVQKKNLGIKNVSLNYEKFVIFRGESFELKQDQIDDYKRKIEENLKKIDGRFTLNAQLQKVKSEVKINNKGQFVTHIPGKYITKMLKRVVENTFGIQNRSQDSFNYKIAEKCELGSLNYLKLEVANYLN